MRFACGMSSFSTATRLAESSSAMKVRPVMLRPGFARLSAKPAATGSPLKMNTMGTRSRSALA